MSCSLSVKVYLSFIPHITSTVTQLQNDKLDSFSSSLRSQLGFIVQKRGLYESFGTHIYIGATIYDYILYMDFFLFDSLTCVVSKKKL
jgi:hypothetical protein